MKTQTPQGRWLGSCTIDELFLALRRRDRGQRIAKRKADQLEALTERQLEEMRSGPLAEAFEEDRQQAVRDVRDCGPERAAEFYRDHGQLDLYRALGVNFRQRGQHGRQPGTASARRRGSTRTATRAGPDDSDGESDPPGHAPPAEEEIQKAERLCRECGEPCKVGRAHLLSLP